MSGIGYIGKLTNLPQEVNGAQAASEVENKQGELPGKIVSFDAQTQTASVQPLIKAIFNGVAVDYPQLDEVPVRFSRAGFGAMTYPIQVGDIVTLRPQMRTNEDYHTDGEYTENPDARYYSLSDMEAYLDGGESLQDSIPNFDGSNIHLRFDPQGTYGVKGSNSGNVRVTSNLIALEGNSGEVIDLVAELCEKLAADIDTGGDTMGNAADYATIGAKFRAMQLT